jgi:hypothetical protein
MKTTCMIIVFLPSKTQGKAIYLSGNSHCRNWKIRNIRIIYSYPSSRWSTNCPNWCPIQFLLEGYWNLSKKVYGCIYYFLCHYFVYFTKKECFLHVIESMSFFFKQMVFKLQHLAMYLFKNTINSISYYFKRYW